MGWNWHICIWLIAKTQAHSGVCTHACLSFSLCRHFTCFIATWDSSFIFSYFLAVFFSLIFIPFQVYIALLWVRLVDRLISAPNLKRTSHHPNTSLYSFSRTYICVHPFLIPSSSVWIDKKIETIKKEKNWTSLVACNCKYWLIIIKVRQYRSAANRDMTHLDDRRGFLGSGSGKSTRASEIEGIMLDHAFSPRL